MPSKILRDLRVPKRTTGKYLAGVDAWRILVQCIVTTPPVFQFAFCYGDKTDKATLGEGRIYLVSLYHSPSLKKVRTEAGTGRKPRKAAYWLALSLTPFLYKTGSPPDVLLPHSEQGPPTPIISQENAPRLAY